MLSHMPTDAAIVCMGMDLKNLFFSVELGENFWLGAGEEMGAGREELCFSCQELGEGSQSRILMHQSALTIDFDMGAWLAAAHGSAPLMS